MRASASLLEVRAVVEVRASASRGGASRGSTRGASRGSTGGACRSSVVVEVQAVEVRAVVV